uniref:Fiber protein Fb34 n=1 Tax=Oryza glumipatula TaxID=40148 RepID=A0A0E0B0R2_9ORYZ
MGDTERSSILVHILVIALCLTAFGFAIAAERRRSTGSIVTDSFNSTFCVYDSDIATGYGVGAFLFLLSGQSLLMVVTKCMCFGKPLAPGGSRAWSIIYFASSWVTFMIAESCLIAGATKNAYHTRYRHMVYAGSWTCESLRKGVFIAGAVFVVFTMILNVYFYMYYTKSTSQAAKKINKTTPNVGMTGYA